MTGGIWAAGHLSCHLSGGDEVDRECEGEEDKGKRGES